MIITSIEFNLHQTKANSFPEFFFLPVFQFHLLDGVCFVDLVYTLGFVPPNAPFFPADPALPPLEGPGTLNAPL